MFESPCFLLDKITQQQQKEFLGNSLNIGDGGKTRKTNINTNFSAHTQNPPFWATPGKKVYVPSPHFLEKNTQKRDPHKLFRGDFWGRKRGPRQAIFGHKKFSSFFPVLPFLVFLEKGKENHPKNKDFFIPTEPLKSLEKERKTLKKKKRNSSEGKNKEFPKNKERKDRVFSCLQNNFVILCCCVGGGGKESVRHEVLTYIPVCLRWDIAVPSGTCGCGSQRGVPGIHLMI